MKRFHVHVAVENLEAGIAFYRSVFGAEPTVTKPDYAKWMLDDPRINFAISSRGAATGVNHLGFQLDSDEEFRAMQAQLQQADSAMVAQEAAACCYARSDKYWVTDPAGIAWETFHTLGAVPVFGEDTITTAETAGCCAPAAAQEPARASCCSSA